MKRLGDGESQEHRTGDRQEHLAPEIKRGDGDDHARHGRQGRARMAPGSGEQAREPITTIGRHHRASILSGADPRYLARVQRALARSFADAYSSK
jgi:hypothetical protein